MEKVVDNKDLMVCTRGDPVIYIRSSKDFEWKGMEMNGMK